MKFLHSIDIVNIAGSDIIYKNIKKLSNCVVADAANSYKDTNSEASVKKQYNIKA